MENKITFVIGTKAELIKCMPLMLELQKEKKDYWFIHTGQHMLGEACEKFGIKKPDFILSEEPEKSTKFWSKVNKNSFFWLIKIIFRIRKKIRELKPNYVVYHGDTMSSAAAAISSSKFWNYKKSWKNVHLEAGLRSGSLKEPFPEEIFRRICDQLSDILLAVSNFSVNNLIKEKMKGEIIKVGNTIVDSAQITYEESKKKYKMLSEEYALMNVHRHENLINKKRMEKIIDILERTRIKILWPLHDNTKHYLEKYNLFDKVRTLMNVEIIPLVDYSEFIFLLANCKYLITDGGSIQEESLIFKKPCLILREKTERQEGLETNTNFLIKFNLEIGPIGALIRSIEENKIKMKDFKNPYGERGVSKKILNIMK